MARTRSPLPLRLLRERSGTWVSLLLLALALLCFLPDLDHPSIERGDESGHQVATRGFHDTGLPTIHRAPLTDAPADQTTFWDAPVFLHKPPLPFGLGALLMFILGITPLALRLVSLAAAYATSVGIFMFGRRVISPLLAAALAAAFLCLPFGFALVQGIQWGDVTDCSLLGFLTLTLWTLLVALERESTALAALAGALCGCAFLCKSLLALTPLGAIGCLVFLGARGLVPRPRARLAIAFGLAAFAVAAPWNVYAAHKWPDFYKFEAKYTLGFLSAATRPCALPFAGLFNQVNAEEFNPWPVAIFPIAGLWLLWATVKRRTTGLWLLSLWLWGEWIPLSIAAVKVPGHAWGAAPAVLLAVGLLLQDSFERPWLALAVLGTWALALVPTLVPKLARLLPRVLQQTAGRPDGACTVLYSPPIALHSALVEGLALALLLGALGIVAWRRGLLGPRTSRLLAWASVLAAGWVGFVQAPGALRALWKAYGAAAVESYGPEIGPALDSALPVNAVLFLTTRDPSCCYGRHSLMFYSGRGVYPALGGGQGPGDGDLVQLARLEGFHPYLVSGAAQPFERVASVPASSWLQAYDLDAPRVTPAELPVDLWRLDRTIGNFRLFGVAVSHGDASLDRYIFYLQSATFPVRFSVKFTLDDGSVRPQYVGQRKALDWVLETKSPTDWITDPGKTSWYTVEVSGPPRSRLRGLTVVDQEVPLP